MRYVFSSSITDIRYNYYLKQAKLMFERFLNQILAKTPRLIYTLSRFSNSPMIRK